MATYQEQAPPSPKVYQKSYRDFKGVDLTSAITEVDDARSPYAPNMIADEAGFPCKRAGYTVLDTLAGRINGLFLFLTPAGDEKLIVHSGTDIYTYSSAVAGSKKIYEGAKDARSTSFVYGGRLYILDGQNYISWDGEAGTAADVEDEAYIPTTAVSMPPTGGGTDLEPINLLSNKRINSFLGTKDATQYQLDAENIDSVVKVEIMNSSGGWTATTAYSVNVQTGVVTFTTAPGVSPVTGEDNVRITFQKTVAGNVDKIRKCRINAFYGIGNDNRIFVSGNPGARNYDWYSWSGRADYFPDINYNIIGSEAGAVMGYLKQYDDLIIVKEPTGQDASIFSRSASLDDENKALFVTRQGIAGPGAASMYCFGTLADDNLFLSREGIYGLDTSSVTQQKTTQMRSHYVNERLTKEPGLDEAVCCVNAGYFYVFVNDHVYIADSKQRNTNPAKSYGYEWFYWTDIPARVVCVRRGKIWFGTEGGNLCRFKTELEDGMEAYNDNGKAISAAWATKMDRLSDSAVFKKITKTGTGVLIKPFAKSDGTICYVTDSEQEVKDYAMSTVFDFDNIDFNNFSFGILDNPFFVPARKKKRKAKMWQMIVKNDVPNSAFGLYEIRVNYVLGGFIKR